jgi:signal transduction histidine kinase
MGNKIQDMLESKRELLLAIAHELRTPITRAKLYLELLDDSSRKNDISYEVEEMSTLVNDILESEKLKEGHKVLELEKVAVNSFLEEILSTYDKSKLSISLEESTNSIDKVRFSMAIKNIVNNALFYGEEQKGRVEINQTQKYIEIINYGKEIPKEEIDKLTEAFYRTDKSRTRKQDGGGVGLGLYLVDRIIKAHGFDFKISSENGVTSFKILFS